MSDRIAKKDEVDAIAPLAARQLLAGDATNTASDANWHELTWDNWMAGDDLLDLSDPLFPVMRADGGYAFWLRIRPAGVLAAGKLFQVRLAVNAGDPDELLFSDTGRARSDETQPIPNLTPTIYLHAGDTISAAVAHGIGGTVQFQIHEAIVQKVT